MGTRPLSSGQAGIASNSTPSSAARANSHFSARLSTDGTGAASTVVASRVDIRTSPLDSPGLRIGTIGRTRERQRTLDGRRPRSGFPRLAHLDRYPALIIRRTQTLGICGMRHGFASHLRQERRADMEVLAALAGGQDARYRRIARETHTSRVQVQAKAVFSDSVHQFDSLRDRGHEVTAVGRRIRLDAEIHAMTPGDAAQLSEERHRNGPRLRRTLSLSPPIF